MQNIEFQKKLEKYAGVIVKVGLNIQPGQRLMIGAPSHYKYGAHIENAPLIRFITEKAYQAGASFVEIFWEDDQTLLSRFKYAPKDSFEQFPTWRTKAALEFANNADAILIIYSGRHSSLSEQDPASISAYFETFSKQAERLLDLRSKNKMNFVVVSAPTYAWAGNVYPDLPKKEGKEKLWDCLFKICRIDHPDSISTWKNHIANLVARSEYLNNKKYSSLKIKASGTDLTIGLPHQHIWQSAKNTTQSGIDFCANIPTEEIFTLPHKNLTSGFLTSTKPFMMQGILIEEMTLTFLEGKVVKATAKKGEKVLQKVLRNNKGANRLGEVALVPHSSPISQTGLLFGIPLIDENAACHLALGRSYRFSLKGGVNMTDDEFFAAGGNYSRIHTDFMIGSGETDIDGIREDGKTEPVMRSGEWAFKV